MVSRVLFMDARQSLKSTQLNWNLDSTKTSVHRQDDSERAVEWRRAVRGLNNRLECGQKLKDESIELYPGA